MSQQREEQQGRQHRAHKVAGDEETFWSHALAPARVGVLRDPDGFGHPRREGCNDSIELYLRVRDEIIREVRFMPLGCVQVTACASSLASQAEGRTIREAMSLTPQMVSGLFGGLPAHFQYCAELAVDSLRAAVADYQAKKRQPWIRLYAKK